MVKIILCMIVKNESKIIKRCLENSLPIIDAISIVDTGSTDNTVEIINEFLKEKDIKGEVHDVPWKNFGYNRSQSFLKCVETAKKLKFKLEETFALLLDADMVLKNLKFDKNLLKHEGYLLIQKNKDLVYYNVRIVKLSEDWKCHGVTHEYWSCGKQTHKISEDLLFIDDVNDGGCKSDKYERDIRLLKEGLEEEPDNHRYYFYLAQSYMDSGHIPEAIEWYTKRIEKGGWPEEVFYSMLRIGHCYNLKNEKEKAIFWYLKAHNFRPTRAEAIYEVVKIYRLMEMYTVSYLFAKEAKKIEYPKNDLLFIVSSVYDYLIDFEISVIAFYNGKEYYREGYNCCKKLLKMNLPAHLKTLTESNIKFYLNGLGITN